MKFSFSFSQYIHLFKDHQRKVWYIWMNSLLYHIVLCSIFWPRIFTIYTNPNFVYLKREWKIFKLFVGLWNWLGYSFSSVSTGSSPTSRTIYSHDPSAWFVLAEAVTKAVATSTKHMEIWSFARNQDMEFNAIWFSGWMLMAIYVQIKCNYF